MANDQDSVAFKIMLEERDRLRAEVELLQAELVRRDQAHESIKGRTTNGISWGWIKIPTVSLVAFGRTAEAYSQLAHALAEEIIKANAGRIRPEGNGPLPAYQFSLHYIIPD